MPERVASFTPLSLIWPHQLGSLTSKVSVVDRPTFDEDDWGTFNMRRSEEATVRESVHWLCVEAECVPPHHASSRLRDTASDIRNAALAFQIWRPQGWTAVIVNSIFHPSGKLKVNGVSYPEHYFTSRWAKQLTIDKEPVADLKKIIDGTLAAMESDSVSQKNPFQYLEIGLQTAVNHPKAGALLWMIGLDALLAAQGETKFSSRLCRLLGEKSYIFPRDYYGRQPLYTVAELASDIYQLRNQIAHGDRIRERYMMKSEFRLEPSLRDCFGLDEWSYQAILREAALFALCAALRRVILAGQTELVVEPKAWKRWLDGAGKY